MNLVVVFAAPVPVGHRVRITWYERKERGLAGQTRHEERPHQPRIVDIDTGVAYETDWGVGHGGRSVPDSPHAVAQDLLEGFHVQQEVEGVVAACRVVTIRDTRAIDLQTHLVID